jgi:hypothetical protein
MTLVTEVRLTLKQQEMLVQELLVVKLNYLIQLNFLQVLIVNIKASKMASQLDLERPEHVQLTKDIAVEKPPKMDM